LWGEVISKPDGRENRKGLNPLPILSRPPSTEVWCWMLISDLAWQWCQLVINSQS